MINSLSCDDQWSSCMNCYDQWSFMINVHRFIYDQWSFMIIDHVDHTWSMVFIKPWSTIKLIFYIIKLKDLRIHPWVGRGEGEHHRPPSKTSVTGFFEHFPDLILSTAKQWCAPPASKENIIQLHALLWNIYPIQGEYCSPYSCKVKCEKQCYFMETLYL